MAGVSEATDAGLGSSLVEAHLKVEFSVVGPELLLCEGTLVFVGHFRAKLGSSELWVLLRLKTMQS